jgi:hypothetical protein
VAQMLQVQFDVPHGVFVIFDQEYSEGLHERVGARILPAIYLQLQVIHQLAANRR